MGFSIVVMKYIHTILFNNYILNFRYDVEQTAGGSALNSSRMFSWVLGERDRVVFIGGIGKDKQARQLEHIVHSSGVRTK